MPKRKFPRIPNRYWLFDSDYSVLAFNPFAAASHYRMQGYTADVDMLVHDTDWKCPEHLISSFSHMGEDDAVDYGTRVIAHAQQLTLFE